MKNFKFLFSFIVLLFLVGCSDKNTEPVKNGIINGTVIDGKTNQPISNVLVSTSPVTNSIMTDANGTFNFSSLDEGVYVVYAQKLGYNSNLTKVKVVNNKTAVATIVLYDLQTSNTPPEKPEALTPLNNDVLLDNKVTLKWNCSDADNDKLKYDIILSKQNPPTTVVAQDLTVTEFDLTDLDTTGTYYWKIIAKDNYSFTESNIYSFSINKTSGTSAKDLILYYTFDDATAKDVSGNGNDGSLRNNPQVVPGKYGNALRLVGTADLQGTGSHILLPFIDFAKKLNFTIALWIKEESIQYSAGEAYINWGNASTGWVGISNFVKPPENTNLVINFSVGCEAANSYARQQPLWITYNIDNRNKWTHYALVYKNGITIGYINGQKIGFAPQTIVNIETLGAIGKHWWNYDGTHSATSMTFQVDDVRVYNNALSDSQILSLASK